MLQNATSARPRWRRTVLTLAAAVAVVEMSGTAAALAADSDGGKPDPTAAVSATVAAKPALASLVTTAYIYGPYTVIAPGGYTIVQAACPGGTAALGGGEQNSALGTLVLTDSAPVGNGVGWYAYVKNNGSTSGSARAVAVCG